MDQPEIESPCVKVCMVNGRSGQCIGCGRTLKEIGSWVQMGPQARRAVMDALPARMAKIEAEQNRAEAK